MRGFPIVSLPSLVSYSELEIGGWKQTNVQIPKFEVDEYHNGSSEIATSFWTNKYSEANNYNYLKSFDILENNLHATSGVMPYVTYSNGFNSVASCFGNAQYTSNIKTVRIDSFYLFKIDHNLGTLNFVENENVLSPFYINIPNVKQIGNYFNLNFSNNLSSVYINAEKLEVVSKKYLFAYIKTISVLNLNTPNLGILSSGSFRSVDKISILINATNKTDLDNLYDLLNESLDPTSQATLVKGSNDISIEEFDLRYWDIWQNTTGKDSGLH